MIGGWLDDAPDFDDILKEEFGEPEVVTKRDPRTAARIKQQNRKNNKRARDQRRSQRKK